MENTKIYNCKYCNYNSNRNFNLKQHEINKHYKEILKNEKETLKEEKEIIKEEVNNNDNNKNEFFCIKCNKKYLTYKSYIKHEEKCNGLDSLTCPICMYHFTTHGHKSIHIKRNNCKPNSLILNTNFNTKTFICNYIYLIKEREFVNNNQNIYKIGKTKQENNKRFKNYPNGSILLFHTMCIDCDTFEKKLIDIFNKKFNNKRDIGLEYFEGDYREMIRIILNILLNYI